MTISVYWYGWRESPFYSLVTKKKFVSYEVGVKKGYHTLPATVQKKINAGRKLTKAEEDHLRAWKEMEEDVAKEPSERLGPNEPMVEAWELLTASDLEGLDIPEEDLSDEDSEDGSTQSSTSEEKKKAIKSPKTGKKRRAKSTKAAGRPPKKVKTAVKEKASSVPKEDSDKKIGNVDNTDFAEPESSEDGAMEEGSGPSGDENDEDYVSEPTAEKKGTPSSRGLEEEDVPAAKPKSKRGNKLTASEKAERAKARAWTQKEGLRRIFAQNEDNFCPLLEKWKVCLSESDVAGLREIVHSLTPRVTEMCTFFVEQYNIPALLKKTKRVLASNGGEVDVVTTCRQRFNTHYYEKLAVVPKEFSIKKKAKKELKKPKEAASLPRDSEVTSFPDKQPVEGEPGTKNRIESGLSPQPSEEPRPMVEGFPSQDGVKRAASAVTNPTITSPKKIRPTSLDGTVKIAGKKTERRAFSLGTFMKKPRETSSTSSGDQKRNKSVPEWMVGECDTRHLGHKDRNLALEFLIEMAERFPKGKISVTKLANSFEAAIYQWAGGSNEWNRDRYWQRIHMIVACVSGKRTTGTLMNLMLNGDFETPEKVINLDASVLHDSFEGRPIFLD